MSAGIFHPALAWSEHFQPAPDLPEPPPYPRESSQRAPANARAGQHGRHVSRPVTDQRHGLTRQCGEDHFTRRPVGHRLTGNRIDDFEKQIAFTQMVSLFPAALDPAAVACLSEAVVIENLTMPAVDKRFPGRPDAHPKDGATAPARRPDSPGDAAPVPGKSQPVQPRDFRRRPGLRSGAMPG